MIQFIPGSFRAEDTSNRANVDFDRSMLDPFNDVKRISSNSVMTAVEGHEDIDIIKLVSYQPTGEFGLPKENEIVLELTVNGIITDDDAILYIMIITIDDEDFVVNYNNGSADIQSTENLFDSDPVESEGGGTDTLKITLNLRDIDKIPQSYFDWTAVGQILADQTESEIFIDNAPNNLIKFTEPTDKSTVFGTVTVRGIIKESLAVIETVEYQVDSKSSGGWVTADDSGTDWSEWTITWDTTAVTDDSPHVIYARAFDGEDYHEDSTTLHVVQSSKDNPERIDSLPEYKVGDTFKFSSMNDPSYMGFEINLVTDQTETITEYDTITKNEVEYNIWKKELSGNGVATIEGIPVDFSLDGYQLITDQEFSILQEKEEVTINIPLLGTIETSSLTNYNPPLDEMDFPIIIGEKWDAESLVSIKTELYYGGESGEEVTSGDLKYEFEALHKEQTDVPAGTFETFVIRSQQKDSEWYELSYYSEELGNIVRLENYDDNNELLEQIDLIEFSEGAGGFVMIENMKIIPEVPEVDEEVRIIVTLSNTGMANLTDKIITMKIPGLEEKTKSLDFSPQEEKQVTFTWKPTEPGTFILKIDTPDDDSSLHVTVVEAQSSSFLGNLSTPLIVMIVILIIVIIIAILIKARKKGQEPLYEPEIKTGPSVFDAVDGGLVTPERKIPHGTRTEPAKLEEPKIIKISTGMQQVRPHSGRKKE